MVTIKLAVVCPEGTVTELGTWAAALPLERLTLVPLGAAGLLSVTVPVEDVPPGTDVGFKLTETSTGGLIVSVAF